MNAIVDTHPKGGDAHAAPFTGSAVPKAIAQPPSHPKTDEGIPAFDPVELRKYFTARDAGKLIDVASIIRLSPHIEGATQSC